MQFISYIFMPLLSRYPNIDQILTVSFKIIIAFVKNTNMGEGKNQLSVAI